MGVKRVHRSSALSLMSITAISIELLLPAARHDRQRAGGAVTAKPASITQLACCCLGCGALRKQLTHAGPLSDCVLRSSPYVSGLPVLASYYPSGHRNLLSSWQLRRLMFGGFIKALGVLQGLIFSANIDWVRGLVSGCIKWHASIVI